MPARVDGLEILSWKSFEPSLTRALSDTLVASVGSLERTINKTLADTFFLPENPARSSRFYFKREKGKIVIAKLSYNYRAIPLARYPVKQYRITSGNKILSVKRGGNFAPGHKFQQRIVNRATIATYVQIRRGSAPKLVDGTLGFKGWLHTGRKRGTEGFYGQANTFAANIFERNQQPTWSSGERLPIHRLFGPSISELVQSKEIQQAIDKFMDSSDIIDTFYKAFSWE